MSKRLIFGFSIISILFMSFVMLDTKTYAVSGNCFFSSNSNFGIKDPGTCYAKGANGYGDYGKNDVFTGRSSSGAGVAIGTSVTDSSDMKTAFINFIHDYLYSTDSDPHNTIGAAFVMQEMLNKNTWPTAADYADWLNRMGSSDIAVRVRRNITYDSSIKTSYYDSSNYNIFYGENAESGGSVLEVYSVSKSTMYAQIEINCGNLLANALPSLPLPTGWSMSATSAVSVNGGAYQSGTQSAKSGDTIRWQHIAKNDGPSATNKTVNYYYQSSNEAGNLIGSPTIIGAFSSGTASGTTSSPYTSQPYTIPSNFVGTICRVTVVTPKNSDSTTESIVSNSACVNVSGSVVPPSSNLCRPLNIEVTPKTDAKSPDGQGGGYVSVKVWTSVQNPIGTYSSPTSVDVTKLHTTGEQYTVFFQETRKYISSWTPHVHHHYQAPDTYTYTSNSSSARSWTSGPIGPCFDYSLTASITTNHDGSRYQVESGSYVIITPKLTSNSYTYTASGWSTFINKYLPKLFLHSKTKSTKWQINQLVYKPGLVPTKNNPSSSNPTSTDPCSYYNAFSCKPVVSVTGGNKVSGTSVFSTSASLLSGDNPFSSITVHIDDYEVGTRVCFAFSVNAATSENVSDSSTPENSWNHSVINGIKPEFPCVIVVKKPKVQIWGGDLSVGKGFTSTTTNSSAIVATTTSIKNISSTLKTFGSWVEYGIFASGTVNGMASGSAFNGGLSNGDIIANYSALSFSNTGNNKGCTSNTLDPKAIGCYTNARTIPDVAASFPGIGTKIEDKDSSMSPNAYFPNGGVNIATRTGDLILTKSELASGKSIILKVSGTVTITGDQTYSNGPYTGVSQIPQLLIIAKNIYISDSNSDGVVNQVDAWLIASNEINTCIHTQDGRVNKDNTNITANDCKDQLTVNGPVMTNHLYLRRTYGSGTGPDLGDGSVNSGTPAEIFNLRADAYLWAYARSTGSGRVQTIYTTELPPRL
jgi:hypothetical protein